MSRRSARFPRENGRGAQWYEDFERLGLDRWLAMLGGFIWLQARALSLISELQ
jgi:hypothetical protein